MEPVTERRWVERGDHVAADTVARLGERLALHPLVATVLARRGLADDAAARDFLDSRLAALPDPALLPGVDAAVTRLLEALRQGERIAVHGDYDVDGITGAALLTEVLRAFGATVDYYIPLRLRDGYGLSAEALRRAAAAGARVALSVDCGVSAIEEAALAADLGLDLIITDHHHPPASLPRALAIVNPQLAPPDSPVRVLAGVGVAFLLMVALRARLRNAGWFAARAEFDLRRVLDLVALGTIADVAPLTGVNRILTRAGLQAIDAGQRPGVAALKSVAGVNEVSCGTVGFTLAPRLNAAGRLEDAGRGVELLLCCGAADAQAIAIELDTLNRERQAIERQVLQGAIKRLEAEGRSERHAIVLADDGWHPGVIGIVASRLVERYHRPTVLIALENGQGKGSARSAGGVHLYQALSACSHHLGGYGGHAYAAGLSLSDGAVAEFAAAFEEAVNAVWPVDERLPVVAFDCETAIDEIDHKAVGDLARLAPYGVGNPEPLFLLSGVLLQQIEAVGEQHLRFTARQGGYSLPCIAFGMAERRPQIGTEYDLLVVPTLNQWRGRSTLQLRVKDLRPTV